MAEHWNRGKGEAISWLRAHMGWSGDECLPWPFYSDARNGRGIFGHEGKTKSAVRYMCELANGPPPTPSHESAHSCGKGHEGCINPRHLSWKTRTENQRDRVAHGTAGRGRGGPRYKLTPDQVSRIKRIGHNESKEAVAKLFGITPSQVAKILNGERWASGKAPRQFSAAEVAKIKSERGSRAAWKIAADYGVHQNVIYRIQNGQTYTHHDANEQRPEK